MKMVWVNTLIESSTICFSQHTCTRGLLTLTSLSVHYRTGPAIAPRLVSIFYGVVLLSYDLPWLDDNLKLIGQSRLRRTVMDLSQVQRIGYWDSWLMRSRAF